MKPAVVKLAPKPADKAADQRRRAVARERVSAAIGAMLDGLDAPTCEVVRLTAIRALAGMPAESPGRTIGTLCRAVADLSPAYHHKPRRVAAEALFKPKGDAE